MAYGELWDRSEAGLNTASTIRVHKLTVLAKNEMVRRLVNLPRLTEPHLQRFCAARSRWISRPPLVS